MEMSINRKRIGQDFLRELLEEARRDSELEQMKSARLRALIRAGRVGGLSANELAEISGMSKPSVYEILRRRDRDPAENLDEVILGALVAAGATSRNALADKLKLREEDVSTAVDRLVAEGAITSNVAGYDAGTMQEILTAGPEAEELLRHWLRRALSGSSESWAVYLSVDQDQATRLLAAAQERVGRGRTALIPGTTTRSMQGPELAITFDVSSPVELFNRAAAIWQELRDDLALKPAPVKIVAFAPPRLRSSVLAAITSGIAAASPKIADPVNKAAGELVPQVDDTTICVRSLTEAAWALRRTVHQERRPPVLDSSQAAFDELQAVAGLVLDPLLEEIQRPLLRALERASDRLGPLPGGRLGSFRGPGEAPQIVDDVSPTPSDLLEISKAAGEALGHAHAATSGKIDAIATLKTVATVSDEA